MPHITGDDLIMPFFGLILFSLLGIVTSLLVKIREHFISTPLFRRIFVPLYGVLLFPAAHFVACRFAALPGYGENYARGIAPSHFLLPWMVAVIAFGCLTWNHFPFGQSSWHWALAGAASVLVCIGELWGMEFLSTSTNPVVLPVPVIVLLAIIASPLMVAMTFLPKRVEQPIERDDRERRDREKAEQIRWLNELAQQK
jgi:hypothetical protein